jgi:hypothetical protein
MASRSTEAEPISTSSWIPIALALILVLVILLCRDTSTQTQPISTDMVCRKVVHRPVPPHCTASHRTPTRGCSRFCICLLDMSGRRVGVGVGFIVVVLIMTPQSKSSSKSREAATISEFKEITGAT